MHIKNIGPYNACTSVMNMSFIYCMKYKYILFLFFCSNTSKSTFYSFKIEDDRVALQPDAVICRFTENVSAVVSSKLVSTVFAVVEVSIFSSVSYCHHEAPVVC